MSIFNKNENDAPEYTSIVDEADAVTTEDEAVAAVDTDEQTSIIDSYAQKTAASSDSDEEENEEDVLSDDEDKSSHPSFFRKPVALWVLIVSLLVEAVLFVGIYAGFKIIPEITSTSSAESLVKQCKLKSALDEYKSLYEENTTNKKVALQYAQLLVNSYGDYNTAKTTLLTAYTEDELTAPEGKEMNKSQALYDTILKLSDTYDFVYGIYTSASSDTTVTADDCINQVAAQIGTGIYNDEFLSYYQYFFASLYGEPIETQISYIKTACDYETDISYLFYSTLASMYRSTGEYEKAQEICNKSIERNVEDYTCYTELCYCALLQSDFEKGLEYAQKAYDIFPSSTYNALLLAYVAGGDTASYQTLYDELINSGTVTEDDLSYVSGFAAGTYTLEDILTSSGDSYSGTEDETASDAADDVTGDVVADDAAGDVVADDTVNAAE